MADNAVNFLLTNLNQLLRHNIALIYGAKDQVESLYKELKFLKAFLEDCKDKRNDYQVMRELVSLIRDVIYEAEDVIDTFVLDAAKQNARSTMGKIVYAFDYSKTLHNVAKDIESIKTKVNEIYKKKLLFRDETLQVMEPSNKGSSSGRRVSDVEKDNVVGFDGEAKTIIGQLTTGPDQLEVISVVGMGGLGKTTLARKVYTDPSIVYHFPNHAWICVSLEYERSQVFHGILSSLTLLTDEMSKMNDEQLGEEICRHLRDKRYLIVIDDVWTTKAWDDLKMAFPNTNNGSRILLTSRHKDVALHANPDRPPHNLRFLTEDESWELLRKKVFREGSCPSELGDLGKQIAKNCHGLPLTIVVLAGLLSKEDKRRDLWTKVIERMKGGTRGTNRCMEVLALSYKHLPHHLKVCFIYFGVFPEDFEIPVWKLLRLWIAEGFIQPIGQECLEDIAEEYLEDLVGRNLVLVAKRRSNRRIKACRIHDMLRELCLREAKEENLFQEIKRHVPSSLPFIQNNLRRICIHSNVLGYVSSKPSGPHVRSFLSLTIGETELPPEHTLFFQKAFKLLRVLDVRSLSFSCFPSKIIKLVHLRYIALFGNFEVLPASISKLWNLQTLIVETTSRNLDIPADIWRMLQLRHLHISGSGCLQEPPAKMGKDNEGPSVRENIQTLSTISPNSCTQNILDQTPNLKKLGIRGKLVTLVEKKGGSSMFDNLSKLDQLETLKLLNDTFPRLPFEFKLTGLPQWYKFPPNLKKLTLSDTLLEWEHMSTLGKLPNLEVLKLKDSVFKGEQWKPLDDGFRLLKFLQIGSTDLMHWEASDHHFPSLQRLVLKHCKRLQAIPSGLGNSSALQILDLYRTSSSAAASARQIQQQRSMVNKEFELLIYPPDL